MKTAKPDFRHIDKIQIRFSDIDVIGHVNNSIHQNYFDLSRLSYFKKVIGDKIDWKSFSVVLASIQIDYFQPVFLDDNISIRTRVTQIGDKSFTMEQELFSDRTSEIKSFNRAVLVGYSAILNETVPIPDEWKEKMFEFEESITLKYPLSNN